MIPITRKELYLNKIVGNDDYSVPEKPISEEEFFFAEILGEAVQAPEPLTRYQMYLAKIAGCEIEIPYPEVRLEYFLAKAAGMEIETPTPITNEEIFWSKYSAVIEKEVEGVPPIVYDLKKGSLKNYRIYGNKDGVGDYISDGEDAGKYSISLTVQGKNLLPPPDANVISRVEQDGVIFEVSNDGVYSARSIDESGAEKSTFYNFDLKTKVKIPDSKSDGGRGFIHLYNSVAPSNKVALRFFNPNGDRVGIIYANVANRIWNNYTFGGEIVDSIGIFVAAGTVFNVSFKPAVYLDESSSTDYESYQSPIYSRIVLSEPLVISSGIAEWIDYAEQKKHYANGRIADVTIPELPEIPHEINSLTVDTAVQPSKVYVKYEGERE